jgi:DnaJ family protein A protein 2
MRGAGKAHDVLNVPETASEQQIRKAYMDLALKNHPDRGGDTEKFKAIQNA